ncbi:MAG: hypothetical protein Q8P54_02865 [bacterium]|nr:hypothetical protein [bacterium]
MSTLSKIFSQNKKVAIATVVVTMALVTGGVALACKNYFDDQAKIKAEKLARQEQQKKDTKESVKKANTQANPEVKPENPAPVADTTTKPVATTNTTSNTSTKYSAPAPIKKKTEPVSSTVSAISLNGSGVLVNWLTTGTAYKGFKVVWSKNSGPTYPTRSGDKYHYLSSPSTSSDTIYSFNGPGTYFVRVCEYLGNGCGVYSNQISVTLP